MPTWTHDELDKIGRAEELRITTLRRDGTPRKPVIIWAVRHGDELYVRSAYGQEAGWFRGVQACREGHISAGAVEKDVRFVTPGNANEDEIDAAYRSKYVRHGAEYVEMVVSPAARATTIRLVPR